VCDFLGLLPEPGAREFGASLRAEDEAPPPVGVGLAAAYDGADRPVTLKLEVVLPQGAELGPAGQEVVA